MNITAEGHAEHVAAASGIVPLAERQKSAPKYLYSHESDHCISRTFRLILENYR